MKNVALGWFSWRCASTYVNFKAIHKNSYYGYDEKMRHFSQGKESEAMQLWTAGIQ